MQRAIANRSTLLAAEVLKEERMLLRCVKAIQFKDGVFDQYSDVPSDSVVEGKIYFGEILGSDCIYNSTPGFLVFNEDKEWKKYPFKAFEPTSGT